MDQLFLAFCKVTRTYYMGDDEYFNKTHLVEAKDYSEAKSKIEAYYRKLNDPYAVSYYVDIQDIEEVIK